MAVILGAASTDRQLVSDAGAARASRATGCAWARQAVAQAEAEFRAEVGDEIATVVAFGLEAYAGPAA